MSATPRSRSARGTRILGSSFSNVSHHKAEMEYTFIKSIVEAYSQQRMPARLNKIPVRADKWTAGTVARLDLSPGIMAAKYRTGPMRSQNTVKWTAGPMENQNIAKWTAASMGSHNTDVLKTKRPMGIQNTAQTTIGPRLRQVTTQKMAGPMGGQNTNDIKDYNIHRQKASSLHEQECQHDPAGEEFRPQSVRHVFHRNSRTMERVLPVWSPELKGDIVFSQNQRPVRNQRPMSASLESMYLLQGRATSASKVVQLGAIHSPLFLSARATPSKTWPERPKTVASLPSHSTNRDKKPENVTSEEGLFSRNESSKVNGQGLKGSTQTTINDQRLLSLDIFLPRESESNYLGEPKSSRSKEDDANSKTRHITEQRDPPSASFPFSDHLSESGTIGHPTDYSHTYKGTNTAETASLATCKCCHDNVNQTDKTCFRLSRKKWIHCELFGPSLCSDCRIQQEKRILSAQTLSRSHSDASRSLASVQFNSMIP